MVVRLGNINNNTLIATQSAVLTQIIHDLVTFRAITGADTITVSDNRIEAPNLHVPSGNNVKIQPYLATFMNAMSDVNFFVVVRNSMRGHFRNEATGTSPVNTGLLKTSTLTNFSNIQFDWNTVDTVILSQWNVIAAYIFDFGSSAVTGGEPHPAMDMPLDATPRGDTTAHVGATATRQPQYCRKCRGGWAHRLTSFTVPILHS